MSPHTTLSDTDRATILAALRANQAPATSGLLLQIAQSHHDVQTHRHGPEDWFCTNQVAFIGEHIGPILRLLIDLDADNQQLRARVEDLTK